MDADLFDEDGNPVKPSLASRLLDRGQLSRLPEPTPMIHGTVDKGTVAVLAGYWGTCKSFVAQHWAASIATGTPWQGRDTEQAKVLYVAAEGAHGLHNRFTAWEAAWDAQVAPELLSVLPTPVRLVDRLDVSELVGILTFGGFEFVVIDTLARCMPGLDENSSKDMGMVVESLYALREAMGPEGSVLAVHHTGKDKSTVRGSSALESGVDTVYVTEGDPYNLTLRRTKRKEGPVDDLLRLRLNQVEGTRSAVLSSQNGVGISQNEALVISHMNSHYSETGASRADLSKTLDMPSSTLYRVVNSLEKTGQLVNVGTDKRPFYQLGDADV